MPWLDTLILIALIPGVFGWLVAAVSSIQIMFLVPRGQRFAGYNDISMWRFAKLRERIGPAADPVLQRMKLGGIAFALSILVVLALVAVSIPFRQQAPAPASAAMSEPTNGDFNA